MHIQEKWMSPSPVSPLVWWKKKENECAARAKDGPEAVCSRLK
jgi:hypothetical protein